MVKPPVVYTAGLLRALGRGVDSIFWTQARRARRPAALLPAQRRRLGRHPLARHRDLPWSLVPRGTRLRGEEAAGRLHRSPAPRRPCAGGARRPDPDSRDEQGAARLREEEPLQRRRGRRVRPATAPGRLPRPPDLLMACDDCNRTELFRRAIAEAGRGLPAIEPGMPLPAGTGLTRTTFVAQAAGLALAIYGGTRLSSRFLEDGIAGAATLPPAARPRLGLPRGRDRRPLGALPGRGPPLPAAAPEPRAARLVGAPVRRGFPAPLAPVGRAARDAARRGQGDGAADGRLRPPRQVALHLPPLLGGRRHRPAAAHRLARPLPRRDRLHGQPAPGALARLRPPAGARDCARAGRVARQPRQLRLLRPRSAAVPARGPDARVGGHARRRPCGRPRPGAPPGRARRRSRRTSSAAGCASSAPTSTLRSRTRSRPTSSRTVSPGSRRCSPRACRCTASRSPPRAASTPTRTSRTRSPTGSS